MIPNTWRKHHRDEDGEHIGYVASENGGFSAYTLFGYPLVDAVDEFDAEHALDSAGLRYLADRWLLTIDEHDRPLRVEIVESTPDAVTVKHIDYGDDDRWGTLYTLDVPTGPAQLKPERALS